MGQERHGREQEQQQPLQGRQRAGSERADEIRRLRDQKLEEEPRRRRKLSPAEEQIIVDILKEYLS